jgi:hypothetical protein
MMPKRTGMLRSSRRRTNWSIYVRMVPVPEWTEGAPPTAAPPPGWFASRLLIRPAAG